MPQKHKNNKIRIKINDKKSRIICLILHGQ
jgi:hypothetical protein